MKLTKRFITLMLAFVMMFTLLPVGGFRPAAMAAQPVYGEGFLAPINAPAANAIPIRTARDLDNMRNNLSGSFVLMNDIDATVLGANWTPVGTPEAPFTGTFDGQGFNINIVVGDFIMQEQPVSSGPLPGSPFPDPFGNPLEGNLNAVPRLVPAPQQRDNQGLFGAISTATVKNVRITGSVYGNRNVGGIAGQAINSNIINCINLSEVRGNANVGGIAGSASMSVANAAPSRILHCRNDGFVILFNEMFSNFAHLNFGGIVGLAVNTEILDCVNNGEIATRFGGFTGGIAGQITHGSAVRRSANTGFIHVYTVNSGMRGSLIGTGEFNGDSGVVGGIVGLAGGRSQGQPPSVYIEDSFNIGNLYGGFHIGGIVGESHNGRIERCFNSGNLIGYFNGGGIVGSSAGRGCIIRNNFNTGDVSAPVRTVVRTQRSYGGTHIGGIVGQISGGVAGNANIIIEFNYNTGSVRAESAEQIRNRTTVINGGYAVGGVAGHAIIPNRVGGMNIRNNVVLSNEINGRATAFNDVEIILGGSWTTQQAITTHSIENFVFNNLAANVILGNATSRSVGETLPRQAFHNQSTWEAIGFCFDTVWKMPQNGVYRYPILQWQTDPELTEQQARTLTYAQHIHDYFRRGGDVSNNFRFGASGTTNFRHSRTLNLPAYMDYILSVSENINYINARMRRTYTSARYEDVSVSMASNLTRIAVGVATGDPSKLGKAAADVGFNLLRTGIHEFTDFDVMPGSVNDLVFREANVGRQQALSGLGEIRRLMPIIEDSGGVVYDLRIATGLIHAYQDYRIGRASVNMGNDYFLNYRPTTPLDILWSITMGEIRDVLMGMFLNPVTSLFNDNWFVETTITSVTDTIIDTMFTELRKLNDPYINTWLDEKERIMREISFWLGENSDNLVPPGHGVTTVG